MNSFMWLGIMVVLILIEIVTLGLTSIWFAAGALCAFITAMLGLNLTVQIIVFAVVSVILLLFTRPLATRYLNASTTKTNAEAIVGKTVRVTGEISNLKGTGQVVVNGIEWTARSADDTQVFKKDELVRVAGIEGVKLIVVRKDETENENGGE